jgi:hypothetical protein
MLLRNRAHEHKSILLGASVITFSSAINLRPLPTIYPEMLCTGTLDNIWFATGETQSDTLAKHTNLLSKAFICKITILCIKCASLYPLPAKLVKRFFCK